LQVEDEPGSGRQECTQRAKMRQGKGKLVRPARFERATLSFEG
jgi:hypothetical protein